LQSRAVAGTLVEVLVRLAVTSFLVALAVLAACDEKHSSQGAAPDLNATPGATPMATANGPAPSSASSASSPQDDREKAVPIKPAKPVVLHRVHAAGQRYALHLDWGGLIPTSFDGIATVTEAGEKKATFSLLISSIKSKLRSVSDTAFKVTCDFSNAGLFDVDASQLAGPSVEGDLTVIEHMLGDICAPPADAHVPGDAWTETRGSGKTSWKFLSYEKQGAHEYAAFEGKEDSKTDAWVYRLRLATDDAFAGTCNVTMVTSYGGKAPATTQTYDLTARRLADTK
jgi:hypothetical protein